MNRKEEILKLIEEGYKTAKELARHFNVSLMTIYRDLKELEEEGLIVRRHGNVELKKDQEVKENSCAVCGKEVDLRLAFIYVLKGRRKIYACCAHCGLLLAKSVGRERIEIAMTRDFITSNPINALDSYYVVGGSASPCCLPPAVAFGDKETAEKFAKGFGGRVADFEKAVAEMEKLMKGGKKVDVKL